MQLSFNKASRSTWLIACLALMAGSACFEPGRLSPEQQLAAQQRYAEQNRLEIERLQRDAAAGNLDASVRLGNMFIVGDRPGVTRDIPKGMAMLENAAAAGNAPAQYALGRWLLDGRINPYSLQLNATVMPRDPQRGLNLLRQAASQSCTSGSITNNVQIANQISYLFHNSKEITRDDAEADLWIARSLIHCQYPSAPMLAGPLRNSANLTQQLQIDTLAKLMLLPPSDQRARLEAALRPEDIETARQKAQALRDTVRESEKQFPAPGPTIKK